jgi:hypothetical protein
MLLIFQFVHLLLLVNVLVVKHALSFMEIYVLPVVSTVCIHTG